MDDTTRNTTNHHHNPIGIKDEPSTLTFYSEDPDEVAGVASADVVGLAPSSGGSGKVPNNEDPANLTNKPPPATDGGGRANDADDAGSDGGDNNPESDDQASKSFPQKLMEILSDEHHAEIISWLPHGTGFQIHKKKTFAADILPRFFKASKFTSFTRKLNRWGFTRVPRGPETGAYFHKLFRRDKPELCLQMTSNSGSKYRGNPMQQALLPNMGIPVMPAMLSPGIPPPMFTPFINPMMAGMTPQQQMQQQALWQQQMQQMMLYQQQQMMQMQQTQAAQLAKQQQEAELSALLAGGGGGGGGGGKDEEDGMPHVHPHNGDPNSKDDSEDL